ncbi:MAG: diguanylate cyclase [Pseudomonadota bacterium]
MLPGDILLKLFHVNPEPMVLSRMADGLYVEVNAAFLNVFGYTREEVVGHTARELGIWEDIEGDRDALVARIQAQGYAMELEAGFRTKSGEAVRFLLGATRIEGDGGPFILMVGRDVTALRRSEQALRDSEALHRSFVENLPLGILIAQDGLIRFANPMSRELLGYRQEELVGQPFLPLIDPADQAMLAEYHRQRMAGNDAPACYDLGMLPKGSGRRFYRVHASTVMWEGRRAGLIAFSDITDQKREHQRVTDLALHDTLTGLPNRILLADRASQAMAAARRLDIGLALLYLDLDGFKPVNDRFGHETGDLVLAEVGRRLASLSRASDTAARVGGDEFALLLSNVDRCDLAIRIARKLLVSLNQPVQTPDGPQQVGASVGISLFPRDGTDLAELMQKADEAMYLAKRSGRNHIRCVGDPA